MRVATLLLSAGLLLNPGLARAEAIIETFDGTGPALGGILQPGPDGPWNLTLGNGVAELENSTQANAIKFYQVEKIGDVAPSGAAVAVDISGDFTAKPSAAGLLYRHDNATGSYLAFVADAKRWTFYQRGPEGVRPRLSGELPASTAASRRLRIQPDGDKLALEIDGKQVGAVQIANMPGNGLGIVAFSTGRFVFDNLAIVPAGS